MLTGMNRTATLSACGAYRFTLTRTWDDRPVLLVIMFNPSDANASIDDPTITLLCHIAAHNGFGGIVVVNGIPLRSSTPAEAIERTNQWERLRDWHFRDKLQDNVAAVVLEVERAGAVLIAWGALAARCATWFDHVLQEVYRALPDGVPLYCLGKTSGGYPKHAMARGKQKVPKDAQLLPWQREESRRANP
jgi:hypothetical protein